MMEQNDSLSIEFMFPKECIKNEVSGKKLKFYPPEIKVGECKIEELQIAETYWYFGKIDGSTKKDFAEYVVPTLDKHAFSNFDSLFKLITKIIGAA